MRRLILIVAALGLLTGAGVAVAHDGQGKTVKNVSATFTAPTGTNVRTDTCTGSDGATYATTRGRWTGTSTDTSGNDPALTGNVTIDATAIVNQTTNYGTVSGHIRIDGTSGGHTSANFEAVDTNGNIAGLADGHGSGPGNQLIANLSSSWSSAGFNGKLGGGTSGGDAVLVTSGGCTPAPQPKPTIVEVHHGVIATVSSTSITTGTGANAVTCSIPSNLANAVSSLKTGDQVDMKCVAANGTNTLQSVHADNGKDEHGPRHH